MESATPPGTERGGLFRANQVAAFDHAERQALLSAKITECAAETFLALGLSTLTQENIYWSLYMTKDIARNEIGDKLGEFIEGLEDIIGVPGTSMFEAMLRRELRRAFNLSRDLGLESHDAAGLLQLLADAASRNGSI